MNKNLTFLFFLSLIPSLHGMEIRSSAIPESKLNAQMEQLLAKREQWKKIQSRAQQGYSCAHAIYNSLSKTSLDEGEEEEEKQFKIIKAGYRIIDSYCTVIHSLDQDIIQKYQEDQNETNAYKDSHALLCEMSHSKEMRKTLNAFDQQLQSSLKSLHALLDQKWRKGFFLSKTRDFATLPILEKDAPINQRLQSIGKHYARNLEYCRYIHTFHSLLEEIDCGMKKHCSQATNLASSWEKTFEIIELVIKKANTTLIQLSKPIQGEMIELFSDERDFTHFETEKERENNLSMVTTLTNLVSRALQDLQKYPFIENTTKKVFKSTLLKLEQQKKIILQKKLEVVSSSPSGSNSHPYPECTHPISICTQAEAQSHCKKGTQFVHFSLPAGSTLMINGNKQEIAALYFVSTEKPFNLKQKKNSSKALIPVPAIAFTYQNNFLAPDFSGNLHSTIQMYTNKKKNVFYFANHFASKDHAYPINALYALPASPSEGPRYFSIQEDLSDSTRYEIVDHKNTNYRVIFEKGMMTLVDIKDNKFEVCLRKDPQNNPVIIASHDKEKVFLSVLLDEFLQERYQCTTQKKIAETIQDILYASLSNQDKAAIHALSAPHTG